MKKLTKEEEITAYLRKWATPEIKLEYQASLKEDQSKGSLAEMTPEEKLEYEEFLFETAKAIKAINKALQQ